MRRTVRLLTGTAVAGALSFLGSPAGPVSTAATVTAADAAPCAPANARVRAGAAHGTDPNTVTAAQASGADADLRARVDHLKQRGALTKKGTAAPGASYTIRTWVHVITRANGTGGVTDQQIRDQIAVLNKAYAGQASAADVATPFRFTLAGVDRTANDDWFDWSLGGDNDDAQAKTALHRGGMADLNLYVAGLADGLLGYATFPHQGALAKDGVVVLSGSLPGGFADPYNQGDTATHEIGHWLGLFHTFQGGCKDDDKVADTPAQADGDNIFFCDETDDTCPAAGLDPVHNYMSYGDDPCLDRFTTGQATRMTQSWLAYRAGK